MSIIRGPRKAQNFYVLDKCISEDKRLTWGARGLLIFLLGKPDNWKVSTQALINETNESRLPSGRDAVRGFIVELIECGYMQRSVARRDGGQLGGYDYIVNESPEQDEPATAQPATAQPATANPPLVRTETSSRTEETNKDLFVADGVPPPAPPARRKTDRNEANAAAWQAYADAFFGRYGTEPVRNAKTNGQIANLVQRLGVEAPHVAAWYVGHQNGWYVQKSHSLDALVKDAESLRTQWARNRQVTSSQARSADRMGDASRLFDNIPYDPEAPF